MTVSDLSAIGLLIILPLTLVAWLMFAPMSNGLSFLTQAIAAGFVLLALLLVAVWMLPPWWTPYLYFLLWLAAILWRTPSLIKSRDIPSGRILDYAGVVLMIPLAALAIFLTVKAIAGHFPPKSAVVIDMTFPMEPGSYFIANGGSDPTINRHLITLDPKTERQRAYRGQSYGIDLVKLDKWGLRTAGWRPADPARYFIFGEPVLAPCTGNVVAASDGMADMMVPQTDTSRLEGNHVYISCGEFAVLLAHLRKNSVLVQDGDHVTQGQKVGEVGNSGQSTEPHLHVHVQRYAEESAPMFSGDPVFVTFEGNFMVRNERVSIKN
ncbi:MAG: M23 family metallopeptidase [Hyphomonas sp.]|nr:M23 family metallopeptidase [Hyphomonas sp.]